MDLEERHSWGCDLAAGGCPLFLRDWYPGGLICVLGLCAPLGCSWSPGGLCCALTCIQSISSDLSLPAWLSPPVTKEAAVPVLWAWLCAKSVGKEARKEVVLSLVWLWRWGDVTWHEAGSDPAQLHQP